MIILKSYPQECTATPKLKKKLLKELTRPYHISDGECPYCLAIEQCKHWNGFGWSKREVNDVILV